MAALEHCCAHGVRGCAHRLRGAAAQEASTTIETYWASAQRREDAVNLSERPHRRAVPQEEERDRRHPAEEHAPGRPVRERRGLVSVEDREQDVRHAQGDVGPGAQRGVVGPAVPATEEATVAMSSPPGRQR